MPKKNKPTLFTVRGEVGERLDKVITAKTELSRTKIQQLIKDGFVVVNGMIATPHVALRTGDRVSITIPEVTETPLSAEPTVLSETPDYVVIEKPAGVLVHGAPGHHEESIASWALQRYPEMAHVGSEGRHGIVHRLDRHVSGVMVLARTPAMYTHLQAQFAHHEILKVYTALVIGTPAQDEGTLQFRLGRSRTHRGRMAARPSDQPGRDAVTSYTVLEKYRTTTLLSVRILTGRTHQIRAHLFAAGFPVVGDTLYFSKHPPHLEPLHRVFLHATRLGFTDLAGTWQEWDRLLPPDLQRYLAALKHAVN